MQHQDARLAALATATAALLGASAAHAGDFAPDGTYQFDAGAAAIADFEDPAMTGVTEDAGALSGTHVVTLGQFGSADVTLSLPLTRSTYRASVWIRGGEAEATLSISYSDRTDELGQLYPTGRVTSDGWVELANDHLRLDGARATSVSLGLFSAGGASADAAEIVQDGSLPETGSLNPPCDGAADPSACGAGQVCYWSECRNVNGWVPPIPADREQVALYLRRRMELLFGPYLERQVDLPAVSLALDQMSVASDPWGYWNAFTLAVRRLHDGHTSTSGVADYVLRNPKPLSLCFLEGDADLSQSVAPKDPYYLDVVVSHTGGDHNLGLHPGDRLVRVDGQHPIAWARSLIGPYWGLSPTSNHRTYAELASSLGRLISRFASAIEVVRCDAASQSCGGLETISIADLPRDPMGTPFDGVTCDNRPLRHLASSPADHATGETLYSGIVLESDDVERIYGLEWESLFTTNGTDGMGAAMKTAAGKWKTDAQGVILDHRTGFGGTTLGPKPIWDFTTVKHASDLYVDRQRDTDEMPTAAEGMALFQDGKQQGLVEYIGSSSPTTSVPVALLVTEDVSASDWLPFGVKGAENAKIFGPFETNGGFSTRYVFGYWLGVGYIIAVGDTLTPDGATLNGTGVSPDVVVLPKQSDLLVGKDSVYEAALAWVRQGLGQ